MKILFIDRRQKSSIWNFYFTLKNSLTEHEFSSAKLLCCSYSGRFLNIISLLFLPIDFIHLFIKLIYVDVVIINFPDPVYRFIFLFKIFGVKIVKFNHENRSLLSSRLKTASLNIMHVSNKIISVSPTAFGEFQEDLCVEDRKRHHLVVHAYHREGDAPVSSLKLKLNNFAFVGRLDNNKNFSRALMWFESIAACRENARFHVIGTGPELDHFKKVVKASNYSSNVIFYGNLKHQEVLAILGECEALIATSKNESFHLVVLEALFSGCYVLASDIPAHRYFERIVPSLIKIISGNEIKSDILKKTIPALPAHVRHHFDSKSFKQQLSDLFSA
jgi:glycosyltransferase involved in cell wall biosynthesis